MLADVESAFRRTVTGPVAPDTTQESVRKLFQEPEVVLVEQPDVLDLVAQDGHPLDAHAPREAGVLLRVVADRFEHCRVHHASAENLDPAGLLAHRAAGAVARPAADVDLGARLRVGKEARAEAQPRPGAEHLARE